MIAIELIQQTAETLMGKASIEIPEDYLDGLKTTAEVEDGDLSSFVLQAMLENYEVAKQDRRAMCGDTGTPRWYVKMGNEARIEAGQSPLKPLCAAPRPMPPMAYLCGLTGSTLCGAPIMTTMSALVRRRLNMVLNLMANG